jgi:hydrogenase/urease accessory protein HupE
VIDKALAAGLVALVVCLVPRDAFAHKVGLSRGDYVLRGTAVEAELVFEKGELAQLVPAADTNRDGSLDRAELTAGKAEIEARVVRRIDVKRDGVECPGTLVDAVPVEGDGVSLRATYACGTRPKSLVVSLGLFDDLAHGHRHLAALRGGGASMDAVAFAAQRSFSLNVGDASDDAPVAPAAHADTSALAMFRLGIEHILTGYDHLLFLFGLVLVGGRVRSLVGVVTAFTVAHSISLAMAALGVWSPSPRIVEPAIALSIAYVGVENFLVKSADKRWRITFPFGLIHGFGFAGALAEIELPRAKVPLALLMFNLGVEAGQLAVMSLVLPLILVALKREWFRKWGVRGASVCVTLAGLCWFVLRLGSPLPCRGGRRVAVGRIANRERTGVLAPRNQVPTRDGVRCFASADPRCLQPRHGKRVQRGGHRRDPLSQLARAVRPEASNRHFAQASLATASSVVAGGHLGYRHGFEHGRGHVGGRAGSGPALTSGIAAPAHGRKPGAVRADVVHACGNTHGTRQVGYHLRRVAVEVGRAGAELAVQVGPPTLDRRVLHHGASPAARQVRDPR